MHQTTSLDRYALSALVATLLVFASVGMATAGEPDKSKDKAKKAPPSVEKIFEAAGIGATEGCLDLATPSQLREHRERWSHAIDSLAEHHPTAMTPSMVS